MVSLDMNISRADRRRTLATVVCVAAPTGAALTLIAPLAGLNLDAAGHPGWVIGLNAAALPLGVLLAAPFAPAVAKRLGPVLAMALGTAIGAVAIACMAATDDVYAWFALRLLAGLATAIPWAVSEYLLNAMAEDERRAHWIIAYGAAFACGMVAGPLLLGAIGPETSEGFLVAGAGLALCAALLASCPRCRAEIGKTSATGALTAAFAAPAMIAAGFVSGYAETAALTFLDLALIDLDWLTADAVLAVSAFTAGAILLQWPLGLAARRFGARRTAAAAGFSTLLGAVAFMPAAALGHAPVWALAPLWGGMIFGLYIIGLIGLGRGFTGASLASANSAFIMAYMIGALSGPAVIGVASDAMGEAPGFAAGVAAPALLLALIGLRRARQ